VAGEPRYSWTISFKPRGEYWAPQCCLIGGPPVDVDLKELLTSWFQQRGGPAAEWRLQVTPAGDKSTILAKVTLTFTEPVEHEPKRLGPKPAPIAPTFPMSTTLLPPSEQQLRAWAARDAETS